VYRACITWPVLRLARHLTAVVVLGFVATITPRVANLDAVLPARIRSGDHVRWTPEEIGALVRVLRTEGANRAEAAELAQIVHSESRALHLDPLYALALIKIESNFHANAVSKRGAVGLLQVRPGVARVVAMNGGTAANREPRDEHLRDPQTNVAVGLRYLRHLERQFADRSTALAAYNLGPTSIRRRLERGAPIPRAYADRVLATYRALAATKVLSAEAPPPRS
jgi:soluble lytic murein transglycosylase-like protein